ncbi:unnamed protein product [Rotaria socialis]|uniref:Uncharacterized protein n=1 Tax=Rotaria socialis TaxID=392032 RepID=A0A821DZC8_9BILA|nr:unnamed protein product [Rotaria socialis]CAF4628888.1 unnamed protein product [Rotaria socialis]
MSTLNQCHSQLSMDITPSHYFYFDKLLIRLSLKKNQLDAIIKVAKSECHFSSEHGLIREESTSVYLYTMEWGDESLYRFLNKALRNKDRSALKPWVGYLKLLHTTLKKLPSVSKNLWRGPDSDVDSCASNVKVVKDFLGSVPTLFMVEANNGKEISAYSNFPDEDDVILISGIRIRVVDDSLNHETFNLIHLMELTDEDDCEVLLALEDKMNGKGTFFYDDENTYAEDWADGLKEGKGVFTWKNGDRHEMEYSQNMFLLTDSPKEIWSNDTLI